MRRASQIKADSRIKAVKRSGTENEWGTAPNRIKQNATRVQFQARTVPRVPRPVPVCSRLVILFSLRRFTGYISYPETGCPFSFFDHYYPVLFKLHVNYLMTLIHDQKHQSLNERG